MNKIIISKQTELSTVPNSIVVTDLNNQQYYFPPGSPNQLFSIDVLGNIVWKSVVDVMSLRTKNIQTGVTGNTITLPSTPNISTLDVYLNGTLQTETIDYNISGNIITFVTSLINSDIINSIYFI